MKEFFYKIGKFVKEHMIPIFIVLCVIVIFIIVLLLMKNVKEELENYTVKDANLYQYFREIRRDYNTTLTISNEKEITELKINDETVELDSTPFYYQDEKKVLFPQQMSVIFPLANSLQKKIPYFTELDGTEMVSFLKNSNLEYQLFNAFLFDGNDMYFFPDGITIKFMDREISLSPYSYVIVNFNQEVIYYNYEMDIADVVENVTGDVLAVGDGYNINLSIDAVIYGEKSRLLLKNLEYLDNLK